MPLPYEKLTQILGIEATDYPPEHETTPEFMNKKFNELLVNDKELLKQINVLESMLKVKYITNKTVTLADYREQGIYCFASNCTFTDIPAGKNGWLVVLPTNRLSPNLDCKQIWMRWGTPTTNSWMTYERMIAGDIIGEWTQYATTTKTSFNCIPNTGFTIDAQNCYIQNNKIFINVRVTSDTNLKPNTQIIPVNLPTLKLNTKLSAGSVIGALSNVWNVTGSCLLVPTSSHVRLVVSSECKSIVFSVEGDLA